MLLSVHRPIWLVLYWPLTYLHLYLHDTSVIFYWIFHLNLYRIYVPVVLPATSLASCVRVEENSLFDLWRWPVLDLSSPSARSRYLHSRVYRHLYRARLFALAGHERIVGRVLNRALVFGVNEAREGENEIERRSEKKRVQRRYGRERERKRKADSTARTNRERMCMYIDPWTISTSDQRARIQHLSPPLHLARPLQPCRVSHSLSLSLSAIFSLFLSFSLFVPISLPSRSLPSPFSRAPPRDNNYPFDSCARRSQSHDSSSCHFPLCRLRPSTLSIERYLQSITPLLWPARLIDLFASAYYIRGTFN